MNNIVHQSTNLSIIIQALSGLYTGRVINKSEPKLLVQSVHLEVFVTLIQFIFYTTLIRNHNISTMAITRYYDWIITTPLMLISLSSYLVYKNNKLGDINLVDFIRKYKSQIGRIIVFNSVMLLAGYLGETGYISRETALIIGSVAFIATFQIIYKELGGAGNSVFNLVAVVWGLYGVAFMFPAIQKNLMYNSLDLISKNFFAVVLTNEILNIHLNGPK